MAPRPAARRPRRVIFPAAFANVARASGTSESVVLGAVGLIAPWATGILPILTPIAGACLAIVMAGAVATHARRKEPLAVATVLTALSLLLAVGRFLVA